MITVGQAIRAIAERLATAGIDTARMDARMLVAEAVGLEQTQVVSRPELELTAAEADRLEALAARRAAREPMSHVLGRRGFWTLTLKVTADTLAPRPDTETVVEAVLAARPDRLRPYRVLDLGTGTGCLPLALLSEWPNATAVAVDASPAALAVARDNAAACGLADRMEFRLGDWGSGLDGIFDVIVSNPPYIPDDEIDRLDPEVARHEPRLALAGGPDGLDCYRRLAPDLARLLAPGGVTAMEVGAGQAEAVAKLLEECGFSGVTMRADLAGVQRCVLTARP
ncbi:MAG: peptide chain release factor N(5)-glutamine methyltransferase [Solirubrobacterales bacterium]